MITEATRRVGACIPAPFVGFGRRRGKPMSAPRMNNHRQHRARSSCCVTGHASVTGRLHRNTVQPFVLATKELAMNKEHEREKRLTPELVAQRRASLALIRARRDAGSEVLGEQPDEAAKEDSPTLHMKIWARWNQRRPPMANRLG